VKTNKLVLIAALALAACNPYLTQQSVAPPGRSARLDEVNGFWGLKRYRLEVSEGVALALTCYKGGPCEKMKVVSDDPNIAEVRAASLAQLTSSAYSYANQQPTTAFVVIGKAPGTTRVHVTAKEGKRDVVVTVIGPPSSLPAKAAATVAMDAK
jgi:hypothetical protein